MNATSQLVFDLKQADEDHEFYPTTSEMIAAVLSWLPKDAASILDIGAGDGRVLAEFAKKCQYAALYGIEISSILIQSQPENVIPVGTDLFQQNLACLQADYIFCNPPYSQFEEWVCKIISEGYARKAFLVIPKRWQNSDIIKQVIKQRFVKRQPSSFHTFVLLL